mmetsp:Transcript_9755/g.27319  ORF Transcript_9755/g.27319 Transcript_9755/m.27319 type:complete len:282 (-) Transcript_9755:74-919(-)|eukprot:CAMPEP_0181064602 /NCGR_PEP_ID=MMETSP1070-20121207/24283_1 /TAXON_ID=265543 /ORGANISM="Minutocellus polymorphus, Strain NH13" /LENGTH=281 /DNA_ID=CAMNT_0023144917 /DNA_START=196 /DNA_END=1041 /DNA_ORIENTATION=+
MFKKNSAAKSAQPMTSAEGTSDTAVFLQSLKDPTIIERVRTSLKNAHVFKLPPRQTVSVGWRGADWREKVWQGTVKVVERGDTTAILLVDKEKGSIFAVCPVKEGAVERCIDSSRYFVLRIENASGRHMFIGVAFNERNDAFDFNAALEDSKREKEMEQMPVPTYNGPAKDYSLQAGEKIHVAIPKKSPTDLDGDGFGTASKRRAEKRGDGTKSSGGGGGFLKPPPRDTAARALEQSGVDGGGSAPNVVNDGFGEPFSSATFGNDDDNNPFRSSGSDPFFD